MAQSEIYSDQPPFLIARNSEVVMRAYSLATYCLHFLLSYHELLEVYQPFLFRSQFHKHFRVIHFMSILVNLGNLPPHKIIYRNYKIKMKYAWYELRR